jgi:hypothetical protein
MLELASGTASSTTTLVASCIAAVATIVAAVLVVRQSARAQSYEQLLQDLARLLEGSEERVTKAVKKALRNVLGVRSPHRRWYEGDESDRLSDDP